MANWLLPLIFFNAALLSFLAHPDTKMPSWLNVALHAVSAGVATVLARMQPGGKTEENAESKTDPPVK